MSDDTFNEMADEILSLRTKLAAAERERDRAQDEAVNAHRAWSAAERENEALLETIRALDEDCADAERERARLREVLLEASPERNDWDSIARLMDAQGWPAAAGQIRRFAAVLATPPAPEEDERTAAAPAPEQTDMTDPD